jgi:uncharacterized OsmC-like protein
MEINGTKEYNEHPASFVTLNVNVSIEADTKNREKLERLVKLAEENCTVSNTLKNAVAPRISVAVA